MNVEAMRAAADLRVSRTRTADRPSQRRRSDGGPSAAPARIQCRQADPTSNNSTSTLVVGYASVTESPYEMYDWAGPYSEVVTKGAFEKTLAANPMVEFTVNHGAGGAIPMAHTRNGTLSLSEDSTGLAYSAEVDEGRSDVRDMIAALSRGDLAEASFKFRIVSGMWSPDYTEYRINEVDVDRGDVSVVNVGANPAASAALEKRSDLLAVRLRLAAVV